MFPNFELLRGSQQKRHLVCQDANSAGIISTCRTTPSIGGPRKCLMVEVVIDGNILIKVCDHLCCWSFEISNLRSIPEPEHGNILAEVGVNFHFQQSGRFQNGLVVHRDLDGYLQVNSNQDNIRSLNAITWYLKSNGFIGDWLVVPLLTAKGSDCQRRVGLQHWPGTHSTTCQCLAHCSTIFVCHWDRQKRGPNTNLVGQLLRWVSVSSSAGTGGLCIAMYKNGENLKVFFVKLKKSVL